MNVRAILASLAIAPLALAAEEGAHAGHEKAGVLPTIAQGIVPMRMRAVPVKKLPSVAPLFMTRS